MEHQLPNEVVEWELEMQEAVEIEERRQEELRVAQVLVDKSLSIEESVVEYQRELWRNHHYEYYNLEGGAEDEDKDIVDFSRGRGVHQRRYVPRISHRRLISHRRYIGRCGDGFVKIMHT